MRVHTLDLHFQNTPGLIAAYVIESEGSLTLIETGPGSTLPALLSGLRALNFSEKQVRQVLVTHIHLDHAGAAGWWAQQGAQVYCHANAARHLVDPTKLIASARMVYQDQMDSLWGQMLPAPAERVTILQDGDRLSLSRSGPEIIAWDTPGHARHHLAFVLGSACFTGDVAGMRLQGTDYLSVTSAPPQFEPAAYLASVDRLAVAGFEKLYLTHFGQVTDPADHLRRYRARIQDVHEAVRADCTAGHDAETIRARHAQRERALAASQGISDTDWQRLEMSNGTHMCADGIRLCVEKARS
ncbi:MAG: MBL fold metallo-hydrolase [Prosthecobacter sp.]|nr:MBL fold metallo-hydrolase [Prosthecobacter sp.]